MKARRSSAAIAALLVSMLGCAAAADDRLAPWRQGVQIRPVVPDAGRHTIHSYFNTCPESPDGRQVLYFASAVPDAHHGDVCIRDRTTGAVRVLAKDIHVEDAHRVACQQWLSKGRRVAFHGENDDGWCTAVVDLESGVLRVVARGQLTGWGQPHADLLPLYGPHWNPGEHRHLDLLNVATGEKRTAVTVDAVKEAYPEWYARSFPGPLPSIFFPVLSPDLKRVFFKMASAGASGSSPRSRSASSRQGLICYSLEENRFLYMNAKWGHPSWHPDARHIIEASNLVYDSDNGSHRRVPGVPIFRGDHPSTSADGNFIVTDTTLEKFGGTEQEWGVVVFDARGGDHVILHRFHNARGARSWRRSHPHPVFSPDGRRIYYNVSSGPWTQLHVAERGDGHPGN